MSPTPPPAVHRPPGVDRWRIRVTDLPPFPCCGERGAHHLWCEYHPENAETPAERVQGEAGEGAE